MSTNHKVALRGLVAATSLLVFSMSSSGAVVDCSLEDATANEAFAAACHFYSGKLNGSKNETAHMNSLWGGDGAFLAIGKFERDSGFEGENDEFTFSVVEGHETHKYGYTLTVDPDSQWYGKTVDWVLGVKQANDSFISYLFTDVTLDIEGGFNNFWLNPNDVEVEDYSFAAGFVRQVEVPEPGSLALLGVGLLGMGLRRFRKSS